MVSGPEALRRLDRSMREIREEERDISRKSADASAKIARLREVESEQFVALANMRLAPERQKEITEFISRAEKDANDILLRHKAKFEEVSHELAALDKDVETVRATRDEASKKLEDAQRELDRLSEDVYRSLDNDTAYQAQKAKLDEAVATAERANEKAVVAEQDREEKGAPFRQDPLFMYLYERGFNTSSYKANNLIRYFDGLVANLVGYHKVKPNFVILNEIPMRLREHVDYLQENVDEAKAELDVLEDAAFDAHGGKVARLAADTTHAEIDQLDAHLVALEDQRDELVHKHRKFSEGQSPAFREAVDLLANGLKREGLEDLYAAARQTATREDDQIVRKIDAVRSEINALEQEIGESKHRLKTLADRRRELEDIEWEFKRSKFDSPSFKFDDDLVEDILGEFLKGAISASSYWGQWQKGQSWTGSERSRSKSRSRSSSNPWGSKSSRKSKDWGTFGSSSKDFSRPRSTPRGSKGSRGHDGFKTGGKF